MLKREMKINFKNFLIWLSILIGLFLVVYLIYPSLINSESMKSINDMMQIFPEDLLKAFNMDISSIDTAFGWLKTEGFVFVLLITGIYSSILGTNILLKEENDKTIEYLNSLPITRKDIMKSKILCGLINITLMIIIFGIFNLIALTLSGKFDISLYLLLSITPLFSSLSIFAISLFISTFFHKTKQSISISLGLVFISYFLNVLSSMGTTTEFLKYISIFTLPDIRNVIVNKSVNPIMPILTIIISIIFISLSIIRYEKKDLV